MGYFLFALLLEIAGGILGVIWFGWHFLLIAFLLLWGNNLSNVGGAELAKKKYKI